MPRLLSRSLPPRPFLFINCSYWIWTILAHCALVCVNPSSDIVCEFTLSLTVTISCIGSRGNGASNSLNFPEKRKLWAKISLIQLILFLKFRPDLALKEQPYRREHVPDSRWLIWILMQAICKGWCQTEWTNVIKRHICLPNQDEINNLQGDVRSRQLGHGTRNCLSGCSPEKRETKESLFLDEILEPSGVFGCLSRKRWKRNIKSLESISNDIIGWSLKSRSLTVFLSVPMSLVLSVGVFTSKTPTTSGKWTYSLRKHLHSAGFTGTEIPWVVDFDLGVTRAAPVGIPGSHTLTSEKKFGLAFSSLPSPGWNPILSETWKWKCWQALLCVFNTCTFSFPTWMNVQHQSWACFLSLCC